MKPHYIFILLTLVLWLAAMGLKAQVTIGLDRDPARAALLQIMSQAPDGDNVTSKFGGGGLVLPRVKLVSLTTLQPFIDTSDTEWVTDAVTLKKVHVGMQVYNLTDDANFDPGIYVWEGAQWKAVTPASSTVTADNGLTKTGSNIRLGGDLTQATTLGLGTSHTLGLTGTGAFTIANPATLSGATTLSGALTISSGSPGAYKVLTSDAGGNATWQTPAAPAGVTADNGLTKTDDNIQLGGSLTKATTVTLGENNLLLNATGSGKVGIGTTSSLSTSAILEVNSTNKGVLLPRVALTSLTSGSPVSSPATGLVVYNTTNSTAANLTPGLMTWDGSAWRKMVTEIPNTAMLRKLPFVSHTRVGSIGNTYMIKFTTGDLTIPETGYYVFVFSLIGTYSAAGSASVAIGLMTMEILINGVSVESSGQLRYPVSGGSNDMAMQTTLGISATQGDVVTFRYLSPFSPNSSTNLLWWKL